MGRVGVAMYLRVRGYTCSCVLLVIDYAMLYDVLSCVCVFVCACCLMWMDATFVYCVMMHVGLCVLLRLNASLMCLCVLFVA